MDFIYNSDLVSTQDEIKITIADLRDLIQASGLMKENEEQGINEYRLLIETILRKNRLPHGVILIGD